MQFSSLRIERQPQVLRSTFRSIYKDGSGAPATRFPLKCPLDAIRQAARALGQAGFPALCGCTPCLNPLTDLTIDVSTACLIAAPSTPTPVVEQAIERARNGEPMTRAKAIEVWPPRAKTFERPRAISCGRESTRDGKLTVA